MSRTNRTFQSRQGYIRLRLLLAFAGLMFIAAATYHHLRSQAHHRQCARHLNQLYTALVSYESDYGHLPFMAFYPAAPSHPHSFQMVLAPRLPDESVALCPHMPRRLQEKGLGYVWNAAVNGTRLLDHPTNMWLFAEIGLLAHNVDMPMQSGHFVLYADGRVAYRKRLPKTWDLPAP